MQAFLCLTFVSPPSVAYFLLNRPHLSRTPNSRLPGYVTADPKSGLAPPLRVRRPGAYHCQTSCSWGMQVRHRNLVSIPGPRRAWFLYSRALGWQSSSHTSDPHMIRYCWFSRVRLTALGCLEWVHFMTAAKLNMVNLRSSSVPFVPAVCKSCYCIHPG